LLVAPRALAIDVRDERFVEAGHGRQIGDVDGLVSQRPVAIGILSLQHPIGERDRRDQPLLGVETAQACRSVAIGFRAERLLRRDQGAHEIAFDEEAS
jgi:hypothetical protein